MIKDQVQDQIGNLIQTKFNPLVVPGTQLWLDGQDLSTFTFNGSNVSQWDDKSGFNRDAFETIASLQPLYVSSGINSFPSVNFTADRLRSSWIPPKGNYTAFVVFSTISTEIRNTIISQDDSGWNNSDTLFGLGLQNQHGASPGQLNFETHGPGVGVINGLNTSATYNDGVAHVGGFKVDGTSYSIFIDSVTNSTTSTVSGCFGSDGIEPLWIGATLNGSPRYWGFISEIIIYNRALNLNELDFIKSGLENKWDI